MIENLGGLLFGGIMLALFLWFIIKTAFDSNKKDKPKVSKDSIYDAIKRGDF